MKLFFGEQETDNALHYAKLAASTKDKRASYDMQWMGLYEKTLPSKLATLASIERYVADAEDLLIQRVIEQDIARQQLTARGAPHDAPPFVVPNSKILGTTIEVLWADGVWYLGR